MSADVRCLAVVIPVHNSLSLTLRCLRALAASSRLPDIVVVVDDGSTDGSREQIAAQFPDVVLVGGDGNLWWGGAMNVGVEHARTLGADLYLALNSDNVVVPDTVANLIAAVAVAGTGRIALCSQVRRWPLGDWVISAGGWVDWRWKGIGTRCWGAPSPCVTHSAEVDWFPGMGSLVRMDDYVGVGGYDSQRFPHYRADVDFALRLRQDGVRLIYEPSSLILNDQSQTGLQASHTRSPTKLWRLLTDRRSQYNVQESLPFFWRHAPRHLLPLTLATYYGSFARTVLR